MMTRPRVTGRPTVRLVTRGLLTLAVGIFVLLGAQAGGSTASAAVGAVPHSCAEAPGHVALVVDFGTVDSGPGIPSGIFTACVPVDGRDTGLDVLRNSGLTARLSPAGMVCGISGYPTDGCGVRSGKDFHYWSYWHDDPTGWIYATSGAGTHRPQSGTVEGWRFIAGADSSNGVGLDPPRDLAGVGPSYLASNISGPMPAGTVPPTQPPGGSGGVQAPGAPGPAPAGGQYPSGPSEPSGSVTSTSTGGAGTSTTSTPSSTTTPASTAMGSKDAPRITSGEAAPTLTKTQLRRAVASRDNGTPIGSIVGAIVGIAAIVALVAFGIVRTSKLQNV